MNEAAERQMGALVKQLDAIDEGYKRVAQIYKDAMLKHNQGRDAVRMFALQSGTPLAQVDALLDYNDGLIDWETAKLRILDSVAQRNDN